MGVLNGFTNSFTSGEICDDAWDRTDIQPEVKGCELASNFVVRIAGPLGKRRGFWLNGAVQDQTQLTRMIPFRRSVTDALMLEFGNGTVKVWQSNGTPLLNNGQPVTFAVPVTAAQLYTLRWKQVADVIYFRHSTGFQAWTLTRNSDTNWTWSFESFPNGPWLNENADTTSTITLSGGNPVADANAATGASYMPVGQQVTLTASNPIFNANQVGAHVRLRQAPGEGAGIYSWAAGYTKPEGWFCISVGNIYVCNTSPGKAQNSDVTNPPIHTSGQASDGAAMWGYIGDGAGIVLITGYTSPTVVTGQVTAAIPFGSGATSFWALGAYSADQGWPRMWPCLREERLVSGATEASRDMIDLTETAGFAPTSEDYHPGQGTGTVVATDAIRRRIGDDGGELLWSQIATYLVVGSVSAEYLIAGSVLDEPLSPSTVTIKTLSGYGSADVAPARVHKGIVYVTRAGQCLRELVVDTSQQASTDDLSVLATHIAERGFQQLAWILAPDETLWCRLADGGLACLVYHQEQQVRGWCTVAFPSGWICEDIQALPGPGGFETLWAIVSRVKNGVSQRVILMQSQPSDGLFMDFAQLYQGAAVGVIGNLGMFEGEGVTVVANGAQLQDILVDGTGAATLPAGVTTTSAQVGQRYIAEFKSLRCKPDGVVLNARERIAGALVSLKCAQAYVGVSGGTLEYLSTRTQADIPNVTPKRVIKDVTFAGDGDLNGRDPRIVIQDDSCYDCRIYSIVPKVVTGA